MIYLVFIWTVAILNLVLAIVWNAANWFNVIIKILLYLTAGTAIALICEHYQLIILK